MNPVAILYVLALSGPLDSPDYRVRERAQVAMERTAPVDSWPAVFVLTRHSSLEVCERAGRWMARWECLCMEQLIEYAATAPIEEKPWRLVSEVEKRQRNGAAWCDQWGPLFSARLRRERGDNAWPYDGALYWDPDSNGQIAVMVFAVRACFHDHGFSLDFRKW